MERLSFILCLTLLLCLGSGPAGASEQKNSDRIVGYWNSSSGVQLTLCYSGSPEKFLVQVYPHHGLSKGMKQYDAYWLSDLDFYYEVKGERMNGHADPGGQTIQVKSATTQWSSVWRRSK